QETSQCRSTMRRATMTFLFIDTGLALVSLLRAHLHRARSLDVSSHGARKCFLQDSAQNSLWPSCLCQKCGLSACVSCHHAGRCDKHDKKRRTKEKASARSPRRWRLLLIASVLQQLVNRRRIVEHVD